MKTGSSVMISGLQTPKSRFIGFIKQAEAGLPIKELCRKGGFSDAAFYKWRAK